MNKTVRILGTHGVPAAYGGFETAAENIALHLVEHGWRVVVYCQTAGAGPTITDTWHGVERVLIPIGHDGWRGTGLFDWISIRHAIRHEDLCLTFGYNTAFFNVLQKVRGIPNVINMDGIEWQRAKWGAAHKAVLRASERIASRVGTHLIADHPEIATHLGQLAPLHKISTIAYGAYAVDDAPTRPVFELGLDPGGYLTVVCRPTPENSVLEVVRAYSRRRRGRQLVVLGSFDAVTDGYHRQVRAAASDEVVFPGAIYDSVTLGALRYHSLAYIHGHTVGGTNPSLVEALAAGNPVVAHDNAYNRWVAGDKARYFVDELALAAILDEILDSPEQLQQMATASRHRHRVEFTWESIANQYEQLLMSKLPARACHRPESASQEKPTVQNATAHLSVKQ